MQISTQSVRPCLEALEARLLLSDLELNPISHLDPFADAYVQESELAEAEAGSFASSFDLRSSYVTSVKDQGNCGSCWAFATYGSLESSILKAGGPTEDFSENNLKDYHGFDLGPCAGGNSFMSEAYLSRGSGPIDETDDPYHADDDRVTPPPSYDSQYYVREMLRYDTADEIKGTLTTKGALYTNMYWSDANYRSYDYTYYGNVSHDTNHAVTIVGWDDNKATAASSVGAWLIKNSWGSSWEDDGYFWVSYADVNACKFAESFSSAASPEVYGNVYYYDDYGDVTEVPVSTAFNAFTAEADEPLMAVGFFTQADNAGYTIGIFDTYTNGTLSNLLATKTGTLATAGWHTVDLNSSVQLTDGDQFFVYLSLSNAGTYPMAIDMAASGYSSDSEAAAGQSYYWNGQWVDLTTVSGFGTANFCIKALSAAPTADITDVSPDPRQESVSYIAITFSEAVSGFGLGDLALTRDGGSNLLTGSQSLSSSDNITWTLTGLSGITGKAGKYELKLTASGSDIEDSSGNDLAADASDTWAMNAINGTSGADTITISWDDTESMAKIEVNQEAAYYLDLAGFPVLNINGLGGDDTLTVDLSDGNPIPAAGIAFDGGDGADTLKIIGTSGNDVLNYTTTTAILNPTGINAIINFTGVDKHEVDLGAGSDTINVGGTAALLFKNDVGAGNPENVTVNLNGTAHVTFDASQNLAALNLNDTSTATLSPAEETKKVLATKSLVIAGGSTPTATLDLGDGLLAVNYSAGYSPLSTIKAQIIAAYNSGDWSGYGITSALLEATPTGKCAIGYAENVALPNKFGLTNPFGDYTGADDTTLLIRYTLIGDVNLDGTVNDADISILTNNYGSSGMDWLDGDVFGYDGVVNDADVGLAVNNYGSSV